MFSVILQEVVIELGSFYHSVFTVKIPSFKDFPKVSEFIKGGGFES